MAAGKHEIAKQDQFGTFDGCHTRLITLSPSLPFSLCRRCVDITDGILRPTGRRPTAFVRSSFSTFVLPTNNARYDRRIAPALDKILIEYTRACNNYASVNTPAPERAAPVSCYYSREPTKLQKEKSTGNNVLFTVKHYRLLYFAGSFGFGELIGYRCV